MGSVDIICLGEALIDFVSLRSGVSLAETPGFEKCAGGSAANVSVGISKLGAKVAFIGKIGADAFGQFLVDTFREFGVNTSGIVRTDKAKTTLAFVSLMKNGERDFSFYRSPGTDTLLNKDDIKDQLVRNTKIFHFSSVSMTAEPSRSATIAAVKKARQYKKVISFDPNVRLNLWKSQEEAIRTIKSMFQYVDILKMNEDEMKLLTGKSNFKEAIKSFPKTIKAVVVTLGGNGCVCKWNGNLMGVSGIKVKPIDTTGAGDAFMAGLLYQVSRLIRNGNSLDCPTAEEIRDILSFANVCGALTTQQKGAMSAMLPLKKIVEMQKRLGSNGN